MTETNDPLVPMPDTEHPFYARQAAGVRSIMERERYAVRVPILPRLSAALTSGGRDPIDAAPQIFTLTIKKCAAPAPFVGDPLWQQGWYAWRVGVDDLGRHVAASAELEIRERWARP